MAWIVRLVKTGADGEKQSVDVVTINRPDDLIDIANLGLTLAEGKLLLAGLQQEIVAWFKKCDFRVTPEIDKALLVKGFLVLGVTLI